MKTKPPALLLALLFGLGSISIATAPAFAESDQEKKDKDTKESSGSTTGSNTTSCTSKVNNSCGVTVILTSCTNVTTPGASKDKDGKDEKDDRDHKSKDKDSHGKNDRDYNDESHKDHVDRSKDAEGNKVAICHRMGGASVSLVVANDGWLSGHSKHVLDTIGRCEDFDEAKDDDARKNSDKKISASDAGYKAGLTPKQIDCLSGLGGTPSFPPSASPQNRGGVRTLH